MTFLNSNFASSNLSIIITAPFRLILGSNLSSGYGDLRSSVLLILSLGMMNFTLIQAEWVETPNLFVISLIAIFLAYRVSQNNKYSFVKHTVSCFIGLVLILFLTSRISYTRAVSINYQEPLSAMVTRIHLWINAAIEGGISTDTIIFTITLAFLVWTVSYCSAYGLFNYKNIWATLLPVSLLHLTNLSYLTDEFAPFLFLFLLFALPLAVSVSIQGHTNYWKFANISYPVNYEWKFVYSSIALGIVLIVIVLLIPFRFSSIGYIEETWNQARSPLERLDVHMKRLFSGIASKKSSPYSEFGSVLPFQGSLTLENEILFLAGSPEFTYWRVRTYPIYSAHGWLTGDVEVGATREFQLDEEFELISKLLREENYIINSLFPTKFWPVPSHIVQSDDVYPLNVSPKSHRIMFLSNSNNGNSSDINKIFSDRLGDIEFNEMNNDDVFVFLDSISRSLDFSIHKILLQNDDEDEIDEIEANDYINRFFNQNNNDDNYQPNVVGLEIIADKPFWGDAVGFQSRKKSGPSSITIKGYNSYATAPQLRQSTQNYPRWVTETYLQLPSNFNERIRSLARSITISKTNSFDKSKAIEGFLRNNFKYSLNISSPPFDSDGVGYFLFESKKGYSEYFASSMVVMLRSIGIPSRMVVGYAPRDPEYQLERMIIRDKDRHGWVEAYFPEYGWIEFEPTPGMSSLQFASVLSNYNTNDSVSMNDNFEVDSTAEDELLNNLNDEGNDERVLPFINNQNGWYSIVFVSVIALGLIGMGFFSIKFIFISIGITSNPKRVYSLLVMHGRILGIRHEYNLTPKEFGSLMSREIPYLKRESDIICRLFSIYLYGNRTLSYWENTSLAYCWRKVCLSFMYHIFKSPFRELDRFFRKPMWGVKS